MTLQDNNEAKLREIADKEKLITLNVEKVDGKQLMIDNIIMDRQRLTEEKN